MVADGNPEQILEDVPSKIKEYSAKMKLRKATRAIVAMNKLKKLITK
jgi:hypothetical protein